MISNKDECIVIFQTKFLAGHQTGSDILSRLYGIETGGTKTNISKLTIRNWSDFWM